MATSLTCAAIADVVWITRVKTEQKGVQKYPAVLPLTAPVASERFEQSLPSLPMTRLCRPSIEMIPDLL
jgi:hypothetical protein